MNIERLMKTLGKAFRISFQTNNMRIEFRLLELFPYVKASIKFMDSITIDILGHGVR